MTLHNYRSRQVHKTLNGVNPSSSFRDMRFAKSGPNLWQIWQVFGPWASPYGANGQMTMTVHHYWHRQFYRTSNGEIRQAVTEICKFGSHPPSRPHVKTIPLQSEGLRGKKQSMSGRLDTSKKLIEKGVSHVLTQKCQAILQNHTGM